MEDYNKISIDINENGYTVITSTGKRFVFDNSKKMREWLKDNLAPTGEVKRFSDSLDSEPESGKVDMNFRYIPVNGNFCGTTTISATS